MATPRLGIEHLRVEFTEGVAVDDLSLSINGGEVCALIGPDGAGKTTTMRVVSGLQELTRGAVKIDGQDLTLRVDERKRQVGFMPDFSPLYEHLTTAEFLDHFARAYNVPNRARRIEECLDRVWLADQSDALCKNLSRAMKRRLMLAKTILPDPQVLLLDEPDRGLDSLGRIDLWKLVLQWRDAGKTLLISSRAATDLSSFCDKAALLDRGRLIAFGPMPEMRRLLNRRRISVKWGLSEAKALDLLKAASGVRNLSPGDQGALFDFDGGDNALHELLRVLILEEVHVTEWRRTDEVPATLSTGVARA